MNQNIIEQYVMVYCLFYHLCYVLGGRDGFPVFLGGNMVLRCMNECFKHCTVVDLGNNDHG